MFKRAIATNHEHASTIARCGRTQRNKLIGQLEVELVGAHSQEDDAVFRRNATLQLRAVLEVAVGYARADRRKD